MSTSQSGAVLAIRVHQGVPLPSPPVPGDISFLHDSNGLSLLRQNQFDPPLTVLLINNGGGGIFSFLPIRDSVPDDVFTQLWATPQNVDLAGKFGHSARTCPVCQPSVTLASFTWLLPAQYCGCRISSSDLCICFHAEYLHRVMTACVAGA